MHSQMLLCPGYHARLQCHSRVLPRLPHAQQTERLLTSLLVDVAFSTTLQRLALVVLQLPPLLLGIIASQAGHSAANSAADAVGDTLTEVRDLTLSLLALALSILALTLLLQTLGTNKAAERLLGGADGLVPRASLAVGVVGGDAGGREAHAADGGTGVREVVFGIGLGLLLIGLLLGKRVSGCGTVYWTLRWLTWSAVLPVMEPRAL